MELFFSLGLGWVLLQLVSNRIMYAKFAEGVKIPFVNFLGLLLEFIFVISLIVHINT